MGERSMSADRQSELSKEGVRAQRGVGTPSTPAADLASALSALGNQRVQRLLTARRAGGTALQRQEEDDVDEEGPEPIPPAVLSAGIAAEVLIQGALANLQTKNRDDIPAALEMIESAHAGLGEVKGTIEGLDNPLLMSQLFGFRQSLVADAAIVKPHAGVPATLDNAESHIESSSMPFAGDFIAAASSGGGE